MNKHSLAIPGQGSVSLAYPADAIAAADPKRDIRAGLIIGAVFFIGLLGWASVARLDAAAIAPGRLVVSGQRQTVQHRDGGVVADIAVRHAPSAKPKLSAISSESRLGRIRMVVYARRPLGGAEEAC